LALSQGGSMQIVASVIGLAPIRVGLKTWLLEARPCASTFAFTDRNRPRQTKPTGWLLAGKP